MKLQPRIVPTFFRYSCSVKFKGRRKYYLIYMTIQCRKMQLLMKKYYKLQETDWEGNPERPEFFSGECIEANTVISPHREQ
jgi:hypothetical protein